jgi:hypothetical protein
MEALKYRVGRLVEGYWKEKAMTLLEERKASGKGDVSIFALAFPLNISEPKFSFVVGLLYSYSNYEPRTRVNMKDLRTGNLSV